jgi:phytoene dehydrogenase-like protein
MAATKLTAGVPASLTSRLAPAPVGRALTPYLQGDSSAQGGAVIVFLGVPEKQVAAHEFTHHQLLYDYHKPLGNGNNMFISVSSADDTESAPAGHRSVMISTHCDLHEWEGLSPASYAARKKQIGERLVADFADTNPRMASEVKAAMDKLEREREDQSDT